MSAYGAFAPVYDDWSSHMTEDGACYVELAREAEGPVGELKEFVWVARKP